MPRITRSALVPFSAEQMFKLVNDVESYPSFLPGCAGSRVLEASDSAMTASVDVAKAGIRKTFTTRNELVSGEAIKMELVDGPFRKLVGGWNFTSLDTDACKIELNLDFEFKNSLVEMAFGKVFNELTLNMVKAFTQRARDVYER
ncbi:SRPBCC family protein [Enterovibrio nigricans]|uniref:Ribosome association toxin RatA n=1 Tax=Enterovibrio nigricans DSM 22720 TaxID=1121868 RepID=A0A1T4USG2_9GAMM|nr:SRPBCC family protein [Enterovibrio nigricans]SKA55351.1 Ribosome association toxin PasT (RatA) of the RatAB toxin-antitoxin module [Enterovibrio nigricans DSM 22720]